MELKVVVALFTALGAGGFLSKDYWPSGGGNDINLSPGLSNLSSESFSNVPVNTSSSDRLSMPQTSSADALPPSSRDACRVDVSGNRIELGRVENDKWITQTFTDSARFSSYKDVNFFVGAVSEDSKTTYPNGTLVFDPDSEGCYVVNSKGEFLKEPVSSL